MHLELTHFLKIEQTGKIRQKNADFCSEIGRKLKILTNFNYHHFNSEIGQVNQIKNIN